MLSSPMVSQHPPTAFSLVLTSLVRVLFTTMLFTAGGMAVGLFLGIVGTILYGMVNGGQIDMTAAYRHVAIPVAILAGTVALVVSALLEVRNRRSSRKRTT